MSDILFRLTEVGVIAVIRAPSAQAAVDGTRALVAGGVTGIEITYSTPDAAGAIAQVAEEFGDEVLLGAGTLRTAAQVRESVDAGAAFLVSPGFDAELATAMVASGRTTMIGALTPTEVMAADAAGADVIKIFPAELHGPKLIKSLRGPFGDLAFMPTGGVSAANVGEWIDAGVVAVGAGGSLISADDLAAGRFAEITARAREFADAYSAARTAQAVGR